MYLKTIDLNGNYKYFDRYGYEIRIIRETGRHQGKIPDYAFGFLSPKIEAKRGFNDKDSQLHVSTTRGQRKDTINHVSTWWQRLKNWFNSLFSNGNRN
ncbi:MAG: hypothetical protein Q8R96_11650 [Bacteroidota bacterium]|nr:hypothetical protein [Bacteroidota bacterium]